MYCPQFWTLKKLERKRFHEDEKKAFVVSATPFDRQGRLDEMSLRRHLRKLCAAGVSGVYMGAPGAGETYAMSPEARDRTLSIAVEELKGKIGVSSMG